MSMVAVIVRVSKTSVGSNARKCNAQLFQSTCRTFADCQRRRSSLGYSAHGQYFPIVLLDYTKADALPSQVLGKEKTVYTCLDNDGPSTHDRVIADADTSFNDASVTDVDIFADEDLASGLCTLAFLQWPRTSGLL